MEAHPQVESTSGGTSTTNGTPKRTFRRIPIEPLTRDERKHPLAECERCPLGRSGKYVPSKFPKGNNPNGLAFIGEAPAKNEIRQGQPFVGPSGKLLNAVLGNFGVDRDNVLLTNACSCHYPDSMSKLPPEAIDACRPRLLRELQEANVDTIVTLGNSASVPLLPKEETRKGITKLRAGPPKKVTIKRDVLVDGERISDSFSFDLVATFHPAYCLRSQAMFPLMLGDISKAVNKDRPILWYEPDICVIEDYDVAVEVMHEIIRLNQGEGVVVDTESGRDKDTSYGRDDGPYGNVLCVGIGPTDPKNEHTVYVFPDSLFDTNKAKKYGGDRLRELLKRLLWECGIIAQNGKYDIGVLMNFLGEDEPFPLVFDTMLASYACYEVGGIHGLKYMGQEVLGCPDWEGEIKPYITKEEGYGAIPRDLLYRYNAFDVHVTRILRGYFANLVEERGVNRLSSWLTDRVSPMLTKVEAQGMGFDLVESESIGAELAREIEALEAQFPFFDYHKKKNGKPVVENVQLNHKSPKQVTQWLESHGIIVDSTDEDHIKEMLESRKVPAEVKETLRLILEARGVSKLKGTYVDGPAAKATSAGRIHTSYLIHGTTTGRLSSRGPNLQNIPRKGPIKRQFIARSGHKILGLDFAQAELRVLTWLAQDEGMRALFNDPTKDIFRELCRQMIPGFDQMSKEDQQEIRTLIKTFAYGVSYGRTAEGISADPDFSMTVAQAQAQMNLFNARIPDIKKFQREVIERIHRGEDLVNPFGRRRRFFLITEANKTSVENEAMAFLPQSTASDIGLEAACRISAEGVPIVNLVHDALYAEVRDDEVEQVIALMDKIMVQTGEEVCGGGYIKFKTDAKVGQRWSDAS